MKSEADAEAEAYARYGDYDSIGIEGTDPRRKCFVEGFMWAQEVAESK